MNESTALPCFEGAASTRPLFVIVQPYEQTLDKMPINDCRHWASQVIKQISELGCDRNTVFQIFAGQKYREYLLPGLDIAGYTVIVPLAHLGIG